LTDQIGIAKPYKMRIFVYRLIHFWVLKILYTIFDFYVDNS